MMEAIVAVFSDWGIGCEGTQQVVLKADRRHFRELTDGAAVLVGRRTLGDFPGGKPLKGRQNLVLSRQDLAIPGAEVVHSPEEPLTIMADGRLLWRVFDNLLANICKYSLSGTRVYIDVVNGDGHITVSFKKRCIHDRIAGSITIAQSQAKDPLPSGFQP